MLQKLRRVHIRGCNQHFCGIFLCLRLRSAAPDGVEVIVEAEEADHVHGLREARLVDVDDCVRPFGKQHVHQLVTAYRRVLEPVPVDTLRCSAG